jgi:hypothetical protein
MKIFLEKKNIFISNTTAHKYMNAELALFSVVRREKPGYKKGAVNEIFPNLLRQNFLQKSLIKFGVPILHTCR